MKQLQWDKLPQQQVSKTVFNDELTEKEREWIKQFQLDGVWTEMEEDFKAKQLVVDLMGESRLPFTVIFSLTGRYSQTEACRTQECSRPSDQEACR